MKRKKRVAVSGKSGDPARGAYCTPKKWADLVGPWDLDPFSNPRSHIVSTHACMLERGDNGLAIADEPGTYRFGGEVHRATESTRVFIQPPYDIVLDAIAHYGHTRFCALLRFDPSTEWFMRLRQLVELIAVPLRDRIDFEPPPGIEASANPQPHAFYFAYRDDAPPALLRRCEAWTRRPRRN